MQRCIQLAEKGLGKVAPNPMVGCVIVYDDKIIGEGYHLQFGKSHAEVMAIKSVKDKLLLSKSTLYVTLEPCSHFGKTPPCTDAIIKHSIKEVVIGHIDPFALVNGSGIKKLKDAGIKVTVGVLEKECRFMNRRFISFHEKKRPYIILKWAQSVDGFIAPATKGEKGIHWISNTTSRMLVHKWRSEEPAIMVGTATAMNDNPRLTVREWSGVNPLRIVMDKDLKLPLSLHLFDQKSPTIVFTAKEKASLENIEFIKIDFDKKPLEQILEVLYNRNIQSVIVEGGTRLLSSFIENKLWDEARVFTGKEKIGDGVKAPQITGKVFSDEMIDSDRLVTFLN